MNTMIGFSTTGGNQKSKKPTGALAQAQSAKRLATVVSYLRNTVDSDLSIVALHTLLLIATYGEAGCYSSDLKDRLGVSGAAISRTIGNLSNRRHGKVGNGYELITVEADAQDIRKKLLKLTPKGRQLIAELAEMY